MQLKNWGFHEALCTEGWKNMVFKSLRQNILIRVFLLTTTIAAFVYIGMVEELYIRSGYLLIIVLVQIVELIRYLNKSTRDLNS